MKKSPAIGSLTATAMLVVWAGSAWGLSDADKCEADKLKRAGKYAFCRMKAESKAVKKGEPPDYTKCNQKVVDKFEKAEDKWGVECPTTDDVSVIQNQITVDTDVLVALLAGTSAAECGFPATGQTTAYETGSDGDVQAGAPLSYVDNGDGTITDLNTGLMWEKKDDSGGIHDWDNSYRWCVDITPLDNTCDAPGNPMDGTITTMFLATLNGGGGFAGHTDWRIPNVKELQSIVDYEVWGPSVDPAFHQSATCTGCMDVTLASCSCTASTIYWSSTSYAVSSIYAWMVNFQTSMSNGWNKPSGKRVRAVRGGL